MTTIPPLALLYVRKARRQRRREAIARAAYWLLCGALLPLLFALTWRRAAIPVMPAPSLASVQNSLTAVATDATPAP